MKPIAVALLVAGVAGCPTPPAPLPVTPVDASDAAPLALLDAGSATCIAACAALQVAGCVVLDDCAVVFTTNLGAGLIRNPVTGKALTCDDVAKVKTSADALALGQSCGPEDASPPSSSPRSPPSSASPNPSSPRSSPAPVGSSRK